MENSQSHLECRICEVKVTSDLEMIEHIQKNNSGPENTRTGIVTHSQSESIIPLPQVALN